MLPGMFVVIGDSLDEAREKKARLDGLVHMDSGLATLSVLLGHDATAFELDSPLPEIPESNASQSARAKLVDKAARENLTVRQLAQYVGGSYTAPEMLGTPRMIADQMEEWLETRGSDGFNVMFPDLPGGLDDFVDRVVPELQHRGIFRTTYRGKTLRENLGLPGLPTASSPRASGPPATVSRQPAAQLAAQLATHLAAQATPARAPAGPAEARQDARTVAVQDRHAGPPGSAHPSPQFDRITGHSQRLSVGEVGRRDHVAGIHVRVGKNLVDGIDPGRWNAACDAGLDPFGRRPRRQHLFDLPLEVLLMIRARVIAGKARIPGEIAPAQKIAQGLEHLVVAGGHDQKIVGRAEHLEWRDGGVAGAERARDLAGRGEPRDGVFENSDLTVQHGDIDRLAPPRPRTVKKGRDDPDGREKPGRDIADRSPHADRRLTGLARDTHNSAHRLYDHVVGGTRGIRARLAKTGYCRVDEAGETLAQLCGPVAEALHGAGPVIFHQHVGLGQEALEEGAVGLVLEIQGDAFLATVERAEIGRFAREKRPVPTRIVAIAGALHLDDARPQIGQHHGAVGSGQNTRQIQNRHTGERAAG